MPSDAPSWNQLGIHVIAKPAGPKCNLRCEYCFYLEKEDLFPGASRWKMSDETLEAFVRQYIEAQSDLVEEIDFAFQGGEPTLMGIPFFERVLELQKKYAPEGRRISNSLQTNGVLLDDQWCAFLKENDFLVGLSLDGPQEFHDRYRRDASGEGTFDRVVAALECLRKHGVDHNALVCVNRQNAAQPGRVYRFFRERGVRHLQFIPIVEPIPGKVADASPGTPPRELVSPRSVLPEQWGQFLIGVFDQWVTTDVGTVFVRDFDQALSAWCGAGATLCVYARECGRATAIEHNGDLFACDHFVDAEHRLGNIHESTIRELANSSAQKAFGERKRTALPQYCTACEFLDACNGACPKDRLLKVAGEDDAHRLNYLCEGFKAFFEHIDPYMAFMAEELRAGGAPSNIMQRLRLERHRARETAQQGQGVGRNSPCPCGSGRKYKKCCGR